MGLIWLWSGSQIISRLSRALSPLLQNHISGSDHSAARWHGTLYPAAEVVTWICDLDVERPADVAARLQRWFTLEPNTKQLHLPLSPSLLA